MNSPCPITDHLLQQIGIHKSGHRRRLLASLEEENMPVRTIRPLARRENHSLFKCCVTPTPANQDFLNFPDLQSWLKDLSLQEYYGNFLNSGYDELESMLGLMHTAYEIDDNVLEAIGLKKPGHRHRVIAKLKEDSVHIESMRRNVGCLTNRKRRDAANEQGGCAII